MAALRRSIALSAAQSYIGVALQLLSTMALSRILTPAEVGVFAVATAFAALATNFRDFGIAEYLIQARELGEQQIRAAFAVNIFMSWAMALLLFAGSGWVGEFYHSAVVADVMRVQAMNFFVIPFGAINMAWFRREMNFKPQFVAGVLSDSVSLALAVLLALRGHGAMSLAWASFASNATTVLISVYFRPAHFPRLPGFKGIREVLQFGGFASGIYLLAQFGRSAPELVIGRVQGVADVAIFSRAGGLVQLFRQMVLRAIMPVCMPYFAKSVREEGNVNQAYLRGMAIFTVIGWTFLGFLALAAFPAIRIVYGDQWTAAVPLARVLCVAGAIELVHQLSKEALMVQGGVKLASRLQALQQAVQLIGLAAVIPFGLPGACWGLLASQLVGLVLAQWHMHVGTQWRLRQLWQACRESLVVSAAALAPMALLEALWPGTEANYLRQMLLGAACTIVVWLWVLRASGHPLWTEIDTVAAPALRRLLRRPATTD
ncbi:oligosaccharide flippase family protein [Aquabacterium sp.]|uniref:oligosaccharide flippase family protein n=1 Tax=Aquabacterium sp. TaxID=1872578 RepID=UPI003783C4C7